MQQWLRFLLLPLGVWLASCTSIESPRVIQFRVGVDAARQQTATAFAAVNAVATNDEIDRAATQNSLSEDAVPVVLAASDTAAWDQAFANIDAYAQALEALLSPNVSKDFEDSLVALGQQLQAVQKPVPGPVAAGFTELGRVVIQSKAQRNARKFAQQADPAIRNVFTLMAGAVPSLQSTVKAHWDNQMGSQIVAFLGAPKGPARRQIVVEYVALRDQRDAQDLSLASLRQSFLSLAEAHSAMARGDPLSLSTALSTVKEELDETKSLYGRLTASQK